MKKTYIWFYITIAALFLSMGICMTGMFLTGHKCPVSEDKFYSFYKNIAGYLQLGWSLSFFVGIGSWAIGMIKVTKC